MKGSANQHQIKRKPMNLKERLDLIEEKMAEFQLHPPHGLEGFRQVCIIEKELKEVIKIFDNLTLRIEEMLGRLGSRHEETLKEFWRKLPHVMGQNHNQQETAPCSTKQK